MRKNGFTLIELLIVVAIIAILAAIALPNFLEAQVRSKVARAKSDHRALATALECYAVDSNDYPPEGNPAIPGEEISLNPDCGHGLIRLTTPVAYVSGGAAFGCPFVGQGGSRSGNGQPLGVRHYFYTNYRQFGLVRGDNTAAFKAWGLSCLGPDMTDNGILWEPQKGNRLMEFANSMYDATNGSASVGDIVRFGGDMGGGR